MFSRSNNHHRKNSSLDKNGRFIDLDFPADASVLPEKYKNQQIDWLRPNEINSNPIFIADGFENDDIVQGELGDCWLLAALNSIICRKPDYLLRKVIIQPNKRDVEIGRYQFRFYQFGKWKTVTIDDRLPTRNGRIFFLKSRSKEEFWPCLLEKAYAKLHNGYQNLQGGHGSEALVDLTGGLSEYVEFKDDSRYKNLLLAIGQGNAERGLYKFIEKSLDNGSFITAAIQVGSSSRIEHQGDDGLVEGHAYALLNTNCDSNNQNTIILRNVWGQVEWKGKSKDDINDGIFSIPVENFYQRFTKIEICHLDSKRFAEKSEGHWVEYIFENSWEKGFSAGGSRKYGTTTYYRNEFQTLELQGGKFSDQIILSVSQKFGRHDRDKSNVERQHNTWPVGIDVYKLDQQMLKNENVDLDDLYQRKMFYCSRELDCAQPIFSSGHHNRRDVNCRLFDLEKGKYMIVCSTKYSNQVGKYILRAFVEQSTESVNLRNVPDVFDIDDISDDNDDDDEKFYQNLDYPLEHLKELDIDIHPNTILDDHVTKIINENTTHIFRKNASNGSLDFHVFADSFNELKYSGIGHLPPNLMRVFETRSSVQNILSDETLRVMFYCSDLGDSDGLLDINEWSNLLYGYLWLCCKFFSTSDNKLTIDIFDLQDLLIDCNLLDLNIRNGDPKKLKKLLKCLVYRYSALASDFPEEQIDHSSSNNERKRHMSKTEPEQSVIHLNNFISLGFRLKKFSGSFATMSLHLASCGQKMDQVDYLCNVLSS